VEKKGYVYKFFVQNFRHYLICPTQGLDQTQLFAIPKFYQFAMLDVRHDNEL